MIKFLKVVLCIFMIIYIVSPVDLCPGPIDDVIVFLIGVIEQKRLADKEKNKSK